MSSKFLISFLAIILSSCHLKKDIKYREKKIVVHNLMTKNEKDVTINWYYVQDKKVGEKSGFYLPSFNLIDNFENSNFIYYNNRPSELQQEQIVNEKILLISPETLPLTLKDKISVLETIEKEE